MFKSYNKLLLPDSRCGVQIPMTEDENLQLASTFFYRSGGCEGFYLKCENISKTPCMKYWYN